LKDGTTEIICFNCGKVGHMSNECDQGYCANKVNPLLIVQHTLVVKCL